MPDGIQVRRLLSSKSSFRYSHAGTCASILEALGGLISALAADDSTPHRLPRLAQIETELSKIGLDSLKQEIRGKRVPPPRLDQVIRTCVAGVVDGRARAEDPNLAASSAVPINDSVKSSAVGQGTSESVGTTSPPGSRRASIGNAMNAHPDQEDLIRREAAKRARHLPFRKLLAQAPDVLTALRPCWFASPLSVSELMPACASVLRCRLVRRGQPSACRRMPSPLFCALRLRSLLAIKTSFRLRHSST